MENVLDAVWGFLMFTAVIILVPLVVMMVIDLVMSLNGEREQRRSASSRKNRRDGGTV